MQQIVLHYGYTNAHEENTHKVILKKNPRRKAEQGTLYVKIAIEIPPNHTELCREDQTFF